jgi:hypothetical protein
MHIQYANTALHRSLINGKLGPTTLNHHIRAIWKEKGCQDKSNNMVKSWLQLVAEAGEAGRGPGPCKEIFPSLSLCKIIKILLFLKYFF